MIEAEELVGVKLFYLKENSPGVIRTGGIKDTSFRNVHHHTGKKQIVQLREYYGLGITLGTEDGIFMTGNEYIEGIPFDESWASKCGFTQTDESKKAYWIPLYGKFGLAFFPELNLLTIAESGDPLFFNIPIEKSRHEFLHQVMQLYYDFTGKVLKPEL